MPTLPYNQNVKLFLKLAYFALIIIAQKEKSHRKFRLTYCLRSCIIRKSLVGILDKISR